MDKKDIITIFESRFVKKAVDECWIWLGAVKKSDGPAMFTLREAGIVGIRAGRMAWELYYGPLPKTARLFRGCGNKRCVNPAHAYLLPDNKMPDESKEVAAPASEYELRIRFEKYFRKGASSQCWIWKGPQGKGGMGIFNMHSAGMASVSTARVSWRLYRTEELVDNQLVYHLCGNKLCVNPDHLCRSRREYNKAVLPPPVEKPRHPSRNRKPQLRGFKGPENVRLSPRTMSELIRIREIRRQGDTGHTES